MIKAPTIPVLTQPKLIDLALLEIQTGLVVKLSWLDKAYGKAQKQSKIIDKRARKYPAVYIGEENYLKVFPDGHIGNFIFFDVEDGAEIAHTGRKIQDYKAKVGMIVWFDFRDVYPADWKLKTVENVKFDVLNAFTTLTLPNSQIQIQKSWEEADNIYKGYDHKEIDNKFLMRPFGGFRIDFDMKYTDKVKC